MSDTDRIKILLVGPKENGKTGIANYLGGLSTELNSLTKPTIGVRIVEFERNGLKLVKQKAIQRDGKVMVELWDVSGDKIFQQCWPAIIKDTHGVLIVYNPDSRNAEKELDFWHKAFASKIKDSCCLVFAHHQDEEAAKNATKLRMIQLH
ncbi:intraflagellar transport protein ift22 [Acrasis kona]|uniref:Intraflagellar transport protein ift22 n=1 Tax=Acrasis kona TaxID=1008807 RepID=A0AAW2Z9F5_9EUKA